MVEQLPLKYPRKFIELIDNGPDQVLEFVKGYRYQRMMDWARE